MIITELNEADVIRISSADPGLQRQCCLTELYAQGIFSKVQHSDYGVAQTDLQLKYSIVFFLRSHIYRVLKWGMYLKTIVIKN